MRILASLVLLALVQATARADVPADSAWTNELGSTLHVQTVDADGRISGYYINRAAGWGCKDYPYPVTGWTMAGTNTVVFSVKWTNAYADCYSLTSWTGFLSSDGSRITTLWQLVPDGASSTRDIIQGRDTFKRVRQLKTTLHPSSRKSWRRHASDD